MSMERRTGKQPGVNVEPRLVRETVGCVRRQCNDFIALDPFSKTPAAVLLQ